MKKIMIFTFLFSLSGFLSAQNYNSNEEISNLKKQVTTLNSENASLKMKLKNFEFSSKILQDSLLSTEKIYNQKILAIQDELTANKSNIDSLRSRTSLMLNSLMKRKIAISILVVLALILIVILYFILNNKIRLASQNNEKLVLNINKSLEEAIKNNQKEARMEIASVKEVLEKEIAKLR